eukprot:398142-Rhodomonas_salina.1
MNKRVSYKHWVKPYAIQVKLAKTIQLNLPLPPFASISDWIESPIQIQVSRQRSYAPWEQYKDLVLRFGNWYRRGFSKVLSLLPKVRQSQRGVATLK